MKYLFSFLILLIFNESMAQSFEEISIFIEDNKFFSKNIIDSTKVNKKINSLDSICKYDNFNEIRYEYTIGNNTLKLYVFKFSNLYIVTFNKVDTTVFYYEYLIIDKNKNKFYLVDTNYHMDSDERPLIGIKNIQTITEVDNNFNPVCKHYLDQGDIYITSNFIYFKNRWFEELGILQKKVSISNYSMKRVFGEMPIPALTDLVLVFQRELNYEPNYPFWYADTYLETIYYDLPNSSMNKHHPSSYPSTTKKQLNNPVKIED